MRIVIRESGGLGNQLFQYAALRYYAKRYRAEMHIAVDPSWNATSHGYPRPCLLQHFSIPVAMKERTFFDRIAAPVKPWLHDASAPFRKVLGIQVFNEQEADRYCFLRDLPLEAGVRTLYLWGYFQNHAMVEEVAGELRLDLTFREPPRGKTLEVHATDRASEDARFTPRAAGRRDHSRGRQGCFAEGVLRERHCPHQGTVC